MRWTVPILQMLDSMKKRRRTAQAKASFAGGLVERSRNFGQLARLYRGLFAVGVAEGSWIVGGELSRKRQRYWFEIAPSIRSPGCAKSLTTNRLGRFLRLDRL